MVVVKKTSFEELSSVLHERFSLLGVPVSITHDLGTPHQSEAWKTYAKEMGSK